jgi:hypothetical protein
MVPTHKKCRDCGETKEASQFSRRNDKRVGSSYYDGLQSVCKACNTTRVREWRRNMPTEARAKFVRHGNLRKHYGLGLVQYEQLKATQDGRCAICGTDDPKGRGDFHVDHCHETGAIRGLLCHFCNVALGNFKDDIARLEAAIEYLRKHQKAKAA